MSEPLTEDQAQASLLLLMAEQERLVKALIAAELRDLMPVFLNHVAERAQVYKDAISALELPQKRLAKLEGEISRAEGKCSDISLQLALDEPEDRAFTRVRFSEWDRELSELHRRRDELEQEIEKLERERNIASDKAMAALGGLANLQTGIDHPFESPFGQGTNAYIRWRMPDLWSVIIAEDDTHPEYELAIVQLRQLAKMAGFDLARGDARQSSKRLWDDYRREKVEGSPPRIESAQDLINAQRTVFQRAVSDERQREHVEDLRGVRTVAHRTGTRNDASRDYQPLRNVRT